jgi:TolA-binding protein
MDLTGIPAILSGLLAVVVAFGGGVKWMVSRMDRQDAAEKAWQDNERKKLEALFTAHIAGLEKQIEGQNTEIARLRGELTSYVRHVGVLEGLLKANGIEAPALIKAVI